MMAAKDPDVLDTDDGPEAAGEGEDAQTSHPRNGSDEGDGGAGDPGGGDGGAGDGDDPSNVDRAAQQEVPSPTRSLPSVPDILLDRVATYFRVLSQPTRLKLLVALRHGEHSVGELVALTGSSQANVSRHLAALAGAGLARGRRHGTTIYYSVTDPMALRLCDQVQTHLQDLQGSLPHPPEISTLPENPPLQRPLGHGQARAEAPDKAMDVSEEKKT